jgi:hypothetical protein
VPANVVRNNFVKGLKQSLFILWRQLSEDFDQPDLVSRCVG